MKIHRFIHVLLSLSLSASNIALADHRHHQRDVYYEQDNYRDYGRVLSAKPIYQQVAIDVPRESCRIETIAREQRRNNGDAFAGTVVGGLVGAAIGHEISRGRGGATAVGGLIGASIGNEISRGERSVNYRDQEICNTHYRTEYEQRIVGYDVSYAYQGRIYQTRTDRHPGDRIAVSVSIHPNYQD